MGSAFQRPAGRYAMTVRVNFRFGHLDKMPRCEHGRVEGFCSQCDKREKRDG
jgi:hypothetical protein